MVDCVDISTVAVCEGDWLNVKWPLASDTAHLTATFVPRFNSSIRVTSFASIAVCWHILILFGNCTAVAIVVIGDEMLVVFAVCMRPVVIFTVCNGPPMVTGVSGNAKLSTSVRRRVHNGRTGTAKPFWNKMKLCYVGIFSALELYKPSSLFLACLLFFLQLAPEFQRWPFGVEDQSIPFYHISLALHLFWSIPHAASCAH